jgi:hypothetical protein
MREITNINDFANSILEDIKNHLPSEFGAATCKIETVSKPEGALVALTVRKEDSNIAPVVYLEHFYEKYLNGNDYNEIISSLADLIVTSYPDESMDITFIHNWENVKDDIFPVLIFDECHDYLEDKVSQSFGGHISIMFKIGCDVSGSAGAIPVKKDMLENWGIDFDTLKSQAIKNISGKEYVLPMSEMLHDMAEKNGFELDPMIELGSAPEFFILTNREKLLGASQLLNKEILAILYDKFGEYYILPSSIHEVLIIPKSLGGSVEELKEMVITVNENELLPADKLSDNVFEYVDGEVKVAA